MASSSSVIRSVRYLSAFSLPVARGSRAAPLAPFRSLGQRTQSTSAGRPARPPPPPEITSWIAEITARPAEVSSDYFDPQRARHLQRTLPSRVEMAKSQGLPLGLAERAEGEVLPKGHHLIYFQPQSLLEDLGRDGSSTVSLSGVLGRPGDRVGKPCMFCKPS